MNVDSKYLVFFLKNFTLASIYLNDEVNDFISDS